MISGKGSGSDDVPGGLYQRSGVQWGDLNMWIDYRGSLSTVYNDGEISTCG